MVQDIPVRVSVFIVAALVSGGLVYGAYQVLPELVVENRGVTVEAFVSDVNATAGHTVAIPVNVTNLLDETRNATLRFVDDKGVVTAGEVTLELAGRGNNATWFPFTVRADAAPGTYRLRLGADLDARTASLYATDVTVRVLEGGAVVEEGDQVSVRYVGMLPDGRVFYGNLPFAGYAGFPVYQAFAPGVQAATFVTGDSSPQPGVDVAVLGLTKGESRLVEVGAGDAFGNVTLEDTFSREEVLTTKFDLLPPALNVSRERFEQFLAQTGQGNVNQYHAGDEVRWYVEWADRPPGYNLIIINATLVELTTENATLVFPDADEGFTLTQLPPTFPHRAYFETRSATGWVLRIQPLVAPDSPFTWKTYWENGSAITGCAPSCGSNYAAAQNITLTNLDQSWVGENFTTTTGQGLPTRYTVTNVGDETIRASRANLHPFRGLTITYFVTVVDHVPAS